MLSSLVFQSDGCSQVVQYDCLGSSLKMGKATFFSSLYVNSVQSFGTAEARSCECYSESACVMDQRCNCDAADLRHRTDVGKFDAKELGGFWVVTENGILIPTFPGPITNAVFYPTSKSQGSARLSLGPLVCWSEDGPSYSAAFNERGSFLELPTLDPIGEISFYFRTASSSGILFYQPQALGISPNSFALLLETTDTVAAIFQINGRSRVLKITSSSPFNTGKWIKTTLRLLPTSITLKIDHYSKNSVWQQNENIGSFVGSSYLGGTAAGIPLPAKYSSISDFTGCIRGLKLNGEKHKLGEIATKQFWSGVKSGCENKCATNMCYNDAKCSDNWSEARCLCRNEFTQSGVFCEKGERNSPEMKGYCLL